MDVSEIIPLRCGLCDERKPKELYLHLKDEGALSLRLVLLWLCWECAASHREQQKKEGREE